MLSVVVREYYLNMIIQLHFLLKHMEVLYSVALLDCLGLFQNFNV